MYFYNSNFGVNIMLFGFIIIFLEYYVDLVTGFSASGFPEVILNHGLLLSWRARDAKIPKTDNIEKITKPVLIAEINPG